MTNGTQQVASPSLPSLGLGLEYLTPEQVNLAWPSLKPAIKASLPPPDVTDEANAMNNVLAAIMRGELQVWLATRRAEGSAHIYGGVVTQIMAPGVTGVKNLWLYALFIHELPPTRLIGTMLDTLRAFARQNGCRSIFAMTNNDVIEKLTKHLHGTTD